MNSDEDAILQMLHRLFQSFQTLNPRAMLPYYHLPSMSVSAHGVVVMATAAEVEARFAPLMGRLKAQGYARSAYSDARVTLLHDSIALLNVTGARYKADGTLLEPLGVTYLLRKIGADWKIVVIVAHAPDVSASR